MSTVATEERKRGGCLTAFLVLMLIVDPLTGLYYLFAGTTIQQSLPGFPEWAILILGLFGLANFAFALALWKWKKWGMYGIAGSTVVFFLVNALTVGILAALLGLVGVAILAFLIRPVWGSMT